MALKRALGLAELTVCGIGIIIGAGIYALIDQGYALAGNGLWLSFLFAALSAMLTGLSYAELSSLFPNSSAEFKYAESAFNKRFALFVSFLIIYATVAGSAAVAKGFASYFSALFHISEGIASLAIIVFSTLVLLAGIKASARVGAFATIASVLGLFIVIFPSLSQLPSANLFEFKLSSALAASSLIFFAFIGFEEITRLAEEARNPKKDVPLAVVLAIVFTAALYILVSLSVIVQTPRASDKPIFTAIATKAYGNIGTVLISIIALFSTASTVLLVMLANSRMLYGIANSGSLPKFLSKLSSRAVPYAAVIASAFMSTAALFSGKIDFVASASNYAMCAVFIAINASLIKLRLSGIKNTGFRTPSFANVPLHALLAIFSCAVLIINLEKQALFASIIVSLFAAVLALILPAERFR